MAPALSRRILLGAALALPAAACRPWGAGPLALPAVAVPLRLRTAYFHNPRFPRCEPRLLAAIGAEAAGLARQHLGLDLDFSAPQEHEIGWAFASLQAPQLQRLGATVYDFKRGRGDRARLVEGTARNLRSSTSRLPDLLDYARPHLLQPPAAPTHAALAEALVHTQLTRLRAWQALPGPDGAPLLDDQVYNEFNGWLAAAAGGRWPYEVVLTNQLIVSAEYDNNHLHGALRGGVSNGLCTVSPAARHGLVSVLSLHPFFSNDAPTRALRGDIAAMGDEPVRWAAALLVHELGHQLLHLDHPFGRPACIMNPPPLLHFRSWLAGLDARACPLGSSPEMRPGAVRFHTAPP